MSSRNSIVIVASPRPRVGKTLLARLLIDFHLQERRKVAAFDLGVGEATLAPFLPAHAARSEIGDIKGQMALFDQLIADDGTSKVVDLGHTSFEPFFTLASQFGFAEETRTRGIALAILYMLTPDRTSVEAHRALRSRLSQATLVPVHNEILGTAQYRDKYGLMGSNATVVQLPLLAPAVRKYVETPPFSFADLRRSASSAMPVEITIELNSWLRRVYREFRELDLRILLTDLKSAIRL